MKSSFRFAPASDPTFLQKVPVYIRTGDCVVPREADTNELAETTGIVIPLCLCVAERLEDRVSLQDLTLKQTECRRLGDHLTESIRAVAWLERRELGASGVLWDHR